MLIACLAAGLGAGSCCLDDAQQRRFEIRTLDLVWSLGGRGQAAVVSIAGMIDSRLVRAAPPASAGEHPGDRLPVATGRARAYARVVALRLALLACTMPACLPLLAAGLADGLALRRARQCDGAATGCLAAAARHALVLLAFVPIAWAASPCGSVAVALPAWAGATAMALSAAASRVPARRRFTSRATGRTSMRAPRPR